jgi:hypothetical protein
LQMSNLVLHFKPPFASEASTKHGISAPRKSSFVSYTQYSSAHWNSKRRHQSGSHISLQLGKLLHRPV